MTSKSRGEQPRPSRSDTERDLAQIDKLKADFDQELARSEKSGDFAKSLALKKEIDDRVATLKARMETMRSFEPEPTSERSDLEFAENLFGTDYLGPVTIEGVWGLEIKPDQVPEIPFSKPELERAKELNQFLILRAKKAPDGQPLTMLKMHELLSSDMESKRRGKALFKANDRWLLDSPFFTKDTPVDNQSQDFEWALSSKEVLANSTNQHYVIQTDTIAKYLETTLFAGKSMHKHYQEALKEYRDYRQSEFGGQTYDQIENKLKGQNWRTYADQLARLKINQLLRHSPAQAQFDILTYYQDQDRRLLENNYIWTNTQAPDRFIVVLGKFDARGARLERWGSDTAIGLLGVVISRTS
jgi:hypothetical protein